MDLSTQFYEFFLMLLHHILVSKLLRFQEILDYFIH